MDNGHTEIIFLWSLNPKTAGKMYIGPVVTLIKAKTMQQIFGNNKVFVLLNKLKAFIHNKPFLFNTPIIN